MKKRYKAISSQKITLGIKNVLAQSGFDISQFTAQSTRHASSSKALIRGIDLDAIRKTAGWLSKSEAFANFFNRPIQNNDEFARAILDYIN